MTIVVEDGSGLATAVSYCSLADASAYHSSIGNTSWEDLDGEIQEQCLVKASEYLTGEYRLRWSGLRKTSSQALDWPRSSVQRRDAAGGEYYPNDIVPVEVKNACASLALRATTIPLRKDQTQRKSSVTVGPITTTYEPGSRVAVFYAEVEAMLKPFLSARSGQIRLVRG